MFDLLLIQCLFFSVDLENFWDDDENYQFNEFKLNFPDWDED